MRNHKNLFVLLIAALLFGLLLPRTHADEARHKPDVKAWKKLRAQGQKAMEEKQYTGAVAFFGAALGEARNFDAQDDRLVESLMDLASALWQTRDYVASEPFLREAAKIRHGDPNTSLEVDCAFKLARNCEIVGHYDEAAQNYERVETLVSRKLGPNHPLAVECMFQKGKMYFLEGDYTRAEPVLKRCVDMLENPVNRIVTRDNGGQGLMTFYRVKYRPDYVSALDGLSRLSAIYISQNRLAEAENCLKQSLKIVDENAAKGDPVLANTLTSLSKFYLSTTNYAAAEPIMQRRIKLEEKTGGATNDATLNAETELAGVYEQEKKNADAAALFQKILAARDASAGPDSRESAVALANLAKFHLNREQYELAEPLYRRLAAHAEKFGGGLDLTPVLADEVTLYSKLGRDAELEEVYKKQIVVYEKLLGPNTSALVKPLTNCAALLRKNKRDAEAEPLEARAQTIQSALGK